MMFVILALFLLLSCAQSFTLSKYSHRHHINRYQQHQQQLLPYHHRSLQWKQSIRTSHNAAQNQLNTATSSSAAAAAAVAINDDDSDEYIISTINIFNIPDLMRLSTQQFLTQYPDETEFWLLQWKIASLFFPKIFFPSVMGHRLICITSKNDRTKLIGFVDMSLQPCDGTLHALDVMPLAKRSIVYERIDPYICNLLVDPSHRGKGHCRRLINECERLAVKWGYNEVYLHVDRTTIAMIVYIKLQFEIINARIEAKDIIFMKKSLA